LPSKILKQYLTYILFFAILILTGCNRKHSSESKQSEFETYMAKSENEQYSASQKKMFIDSAYNKLNGLKNDSVSRYYYRRIVLSYYNFREYRDAIKVGNAVCELAKKSGDSLSLGRAKYFIALSYYELGIKDTALQYFRSSERILKSLANPDVSEVLLYKAYVYFEAGEYVLAESEAAIALPTLQKMNDSYKVFQCLMVIALSLNEQGNTVEAINYYQKALATIDDFDKKLYSQETLESFAVSLYSNMGLVYSKMGNYDKATEQFKKALNSESVKHNPAWKPEIVNNLALAEYRGKKSKDAEAVFNNALKISKSLGGEKEKAHSNFNLGIYYSESNDTLKAITHLKDAYIESDSIHDNQLKLSILKELAAIDIENSHQYSGSYIALSDSLQNVALLNRNKYARIEYETDQLQDQNTELLRKNSFIIGISVVVLLFVAAIFIIYYLNSRNKELILTQEQQKASEEIYQLMFEQQHKVEVARSEEKNRIAMELHDGILNNIYAVRLNLEFTNRKNDPETIERRKEYIKELQSLETEIRSVSHDLSRSANLVEGKDFGAMLYFMVISQKNNFNTEFEIALDKDIDWNAMSNTLKVNIYRIVQESLQNINKYSQATHALVSISKIDDNQLLITITDDGIGFDVKKAAGGIGLKNLKKRAEALNGLFEIQSEKGTGSCVKVQLSIL
jgi:signal transduction histidine kinase